jgi:hypothetical protein
MDKFVKYRKSRYHITLIVLIVIIFLLFTGLLLIYIFLPKEISLVADSEFNFNTVGLNQTCDVNNFCAEGLSCEENTCKSLMGGQCSTNSDCTNNNCNNNLCSIDIQPSSPGSGKDMIGQEVVMTN